MDTRTIYHIDENLDYLDEEVRLVLFDTANNQEVQVEVDIKKLIDTIAVSPMSDSSFFDTVSDVVKQYLPETYRVRKSQVYADIWENY